MKRDIRNPIWKSEEKEIVACQIVIIDDAGNEAAHNAQLSKYGYGGNINPDWHTLLKKYSLEDIDKATDEFDKEQREKTEVDKKVFKEERKRTEERKKQEDIFARKLEIFEIPEVKSSKNNKLKSKIRKANSEIEAVVHAVKLLIEDDQTSESE